MVSRPQSQIFNSRAALLTVFFLLFFGYIVVRLVSLQIIQGSETRALADDQHSFFKKLIAVRGEIKITDQFSQDGYVLATNISRPLVYVVPKDIQNPKLAAEALASVLSLDPKEVLAKITNTDKKYVPIKRQITDGEQKKVEDLKLTGVNFDYENTRFYPEHNLLSQVLGFVGYKGDIKAGLYGLEKYFEKDLAGSNGHVNEEKDTTGAWIFGTKRDITPAVNGTNLVLTIDKTIQYKAESVLDAAVARHGADSGSVIVLNPKTGAVLAMAGFPNFDPNAYGKATDPQVFNNQPTTGTYEPGSTFKAITMAAAIDAGKITPDTTYVDTFEVKVADAIIKNAEGSARGVQTMTQALDFSLNTGAIFAQNQLGNQDFLKYLEAFHFGKKTGVELPEASGDIGNLKNNNVVNFATASFGQGISITPIQLVVAYAALANGGKMMQPYIVQSKIAPDGTTTNTAAKEVAQVISEKTANTISAMLVDVVENGFGKKAGVTGYYIAGKTGTSQVPRKDGKPGYEADDNIGSFVGYGPVNNPQFVMLVRINHPRDVKFAESTAAPAFGEIAQFILNYYNIPPTRK